MQRELTRRGIYQDKIDGKAGMLTRAALGAYQKANGLTVDCWPAQSTLDHMLKRANLNVHWKSKTRPRLRGPGSDQALRRRSDHGQKNCGRPRQPTTLP